MTEEKVCVVTHSRLCIDTYIVLLDPQNIVSLGYKISPKNRIEEEDEALYQNHIVSRSHGRHFGRRLRWKRADRLRPHRKFLAIHHLLMGQGADDQSILREPRSAGS